MAISPQGAEKHSGLPFVFLVNSLRLMLQMLRRDVRSGELTVLFVALVLAVAALTSVGFLADRVERAVEREAHQLLGGDLLLTADHPWPENFRQATRDHGLRLAESASFPSMVASTGAVHLAEIKAVSESYPLRGSLRIAPALKVGDGETARVPDPGSVWPDERLATALEVDGGSRLRLGNLEPQVGAIVTFEPDRGINPFSLAPRLIINMADLPASGLVQAGSRVSWRLHVAGEAADVERFRSWAQAHLGRGEKIEGLDNARPEVRNIIERAQRFLRLAALLTTILAAVAVGMAARRYMQTHLDACAVMRCLGASQRQILRVLGGEFLLLGLVALLVGGGLGFGVQEILHGMLAGLVAEQLPPPGFTPWIYGMLAGGILLAGFVLPPLLRLKAVPTVRVLRREWGGSEPLTYASYLLGASALAGMMLWLASDVRLGVIVLGGFVAAVGIYVFAARVLLGWVGRLPLHGMAALRRRSGSMILQVVALALGLTTLAILFIARSDLLPAWQAKMPPDAPNRFLINIQPEQRAAVADFFAGAGLSAPRLEPMVKGRLASVNGRKVRPDQYVDDRARRLVEREFNLSSRDDLPAGNEVMAGIWPAPGARLQFSVEKGLAETLNLHVGDELLFEVAGAPLAAQITSLRKLQWDSMRVNFFVIAPEGSLAGQPTSYITSFHLAAGQHQLAGDLVRAFPNITVIDIDSLVRQLQATLGQVIGAVQLVFGFSLLAGLAVLYAALQAGAAERRHELAVLRALGARRRQLRQALLFEFSGQGLIAGMLAGGGAWIMTTVLARQAFQLDYLPSVAWVLVVGMAGAAGVAAAGMAATRPAIEGAVTAGLQRA